MKFTAVLIIILLSQSLLAKRPGINMVRYKDNNSQLKADSSDWKIHRAIKEIPLSKREGFSHISIGGDIRLQYYDIRNVNMGKVRPGNLADANYLEQRYMLHTDVSISPYFRGFVQLTSNHIAGNKDITPQIDENDLDLHQLFGELRIPTPLSIVLRLGRQEVSYGAGSMIGIREGRNVRRSYNGSVLAMKYRKLQGDLFYYLPTSVQGGVFDDTISTSEQVFGSYFTLGTKRKKGVDLYYIGAVRDSAWYANVGGEEVRHSVGSRGFIRNKSWNLGLEGTYQFGSIDDNSISAFRALFTSEYSFTQLPVVPSLGFNADICSGDLETKDGVINTFRPVNSRPFASSPISFGAANVIAIKPTVGINFLKRFDLTGRFISVWRFSKNDFVYNTPVNRASFQHRSPTDEKLFIHAFDGKLKFTLNKHFKFSTRAGIVLPQAYAEQCGADSSTPFADLQISYKF